MQIKGYTLVNEEKINRALNGVEVTSKDGNRIVGGVGQGAYLEEGQWKRKGEPMSEAEIDKLETDLLAEYDRLAGYIKRGNDKVETGSFYDFRSRKPRAEPKVTFVYRFGNKVVKVPDGTELPGEVKAQRILKEAEAKEEEDAEDEVEVKKVKRVRRNK